MKIVIGNDHSSVDLKNEIKAYLEEKGYEVLNVGTDTTDSCDYPAYGEKVGRAVVDGAADLGIAICGTGLGISLAANKVKGVLRKCLFLRKGAFFIVLLFFMSYSLLCYPDVYKRQFKVFANTQK